ncbi:MAG TPA: hypothetical protein VGJ59_00965, partial [Jatrophihabitantaceae bacterium]
MMATLCAVHRDFYWLKVEFRHARCAESQYVSRVSASDLERKARVAELLLEAARELGAGLEP